MQIKRIIFTLAFVFSITLVFAQNVLIFAQTPCTGDTVQQDSVIAIEDDFSKAPIRTPLTPSYTGIPHVDVWIWIKE